MNKKVKHGRQLSQKMKPKVWWKCVHRHEWLTKANHRSNGSGCPECAK